MRPLLSALLAALLLLLPGAAAAEERILTFLSDVEVQKDGSLAVEETIRVRSEGDVIKRGLLRDFPTSYRNGLGRRVRVGFDVSEVLRDGNPEPWTTESLSNGVRVRIGSADVMLEPGIHDYVIRYRTTRQLGYFEAHDELYWNVTGTGWVFPIDLAEARIRLPSPARFGQRAVYTGPQGGTESNAAVIEERPGEIRFRTTAPLGAYEGLTIAASWPKGVVAPPNTGQQLSWWISDNGPLVLGLAGLLGLFVYYYYAWKRAGRGPPPGTVVPVFAPPEGMSAAATRYVQRMGFFDNRTFTAAIIDSAVRGRLRLIEGEQGFIFKGKPSLEKTAGTAALPIPEGDMVESLFRGGDRILMDDENHAAFTAAKNRLSEGLEGIYKGKLFLTNLRWSLGGVLLMLAAMAPPALLTIWFDGGISGDRLIPVLLPLLSLPLVLSGFWWMTAPTREGRKVMDRIAGFRHYLAITEEERLETLHPPEKTPALFERYLPFAIALGVENAWGERFSGVLAAAAASGQAQTMGWYSGGGDPWNDVDGFVSNVGSSLTSTVASASTAPSSSGSGGGGSSGGGGGGGGGGGW